jgi:hypothetical protein
VEKRLALWGSFVVFALGIIYTINANLDNQYIGAGLLLIASALACGIVARLYSK